MESFDNRKPRRVAIVGGGPAGSSLAVRLARRDLDVVLIEKEMFPRRKLCGEFVSPECLDHFQDLGVLEDILGIGGERVRETVFYAPDGRSLAVPSETFRADGRAAVSVSRSEMDLRLLRRAQSAGAEVIEGCRVNGLHFAGNRIAGVSALDGFGGTREIEADLVVDATGRSAILSKLVSKRNNKHTGQSGRPQFVCFKAHVTNASAEKGRCEIYVFPDGYGGLTNIENDAANHCFLVKAETARRLGGDADKIVTELVFQNQRAAETLANARTDGGWLAVALDGFGMKNTQTAPGMLSVGDAAAFADPFTGSGMLMALESAEILAGLVLDRSVDPDSVPLRCKQLYENRFRYRLMTCSLIRRAAFSPGLAASVIRLLSLCRPAGAFVARLTRPSPRVHKIK